MDGGAARCRSGAGGPRHTRARTLSSPALSRRRAGRCRDAMHLIAQEQNQSPTAASGRPQAPPGSRPRLAGDSTSAGRSVRPITLRGARRHDAQRLHRRLRWLRRCGVRRVLLLPCGCCCGRRGRLLLPRQLVIRVLGRIDVKGPALSQGGEHLDGARLANFLRRLERRPALRASAGMSWLD